MQTPAEAMALAALVGIGFGLAAWRLRFLSPGGAVAGGLFAFAVLGLGGLAWAVPGFTFFILSSALSLVGKQRKRQAEGISDKGSRRDAGQVVANGGAGALLLLVHVFFPHPLWYAGFLGAFAAAAADTWGTEVGTLAKASPRLITTGRRVPPGTSGAVTLLGTAAALLGAFSVAVSAWPFLGKPGMPPQVLGFVVLAGWLGALADSLVGATAQARFVSHRSGLETEQAREDDSANRLIRGWRWLGNDQVNWICTLTGALLAMACFRVWDFAS